MGKQTPSAHPGMGAVPHAGGVAFRVWAPHASRVYVTGAFNGWSERADPLASENNGYWSVDVPKAKAGDEYKYLVINGKQRMFRLDPYSREVTNSVGNSIVVDPSFDWGEERFRMPPWNELIIYELHVGTFNPGPQSDRGDFRGVMDKLSYLQDLGVNAIEIMPPMEFPGDYSWGYNPSQPFAVERSYGGAKSFRELVKAAHGHGIAVILDVVYNHFGPNDLDLWRFDGWSENGKGGIYFYNDGRAETPWGDTRPDYGRGEVRQYLRDNALMWLEECCVDGLRWDATAYIRNIKGNEADPANDLPDGWSLMQWVNEEIQARSPGKLTIAEDLKDNEWLTKSTGEGGAGFGSQWDAAFVFPIRQAIITNDDGFRDMKAVAKAISHRLSGDAFRRVVYTESHDEVANGRARVPEEIWPGRVDSWFSKKRSTLGAALVMTSPGIPMLFQGQEFMEDRWFQDKDPLDWDRARMHGGIIDLYRGLHRLRRNLDGTTRGLCGQEVDVYHVDDERKLLAFHRWDGGGGPRNSVVVVANLANQSYDDYALTFPRAGTWRVRFNSDSSLYEPDFGNHASPDVTAAVSAKGKPVTGSVSIGPYTVLILSQDE